MDIRKIRADILHEIAFIESALDDPEHISLDNYPQTLHNTVDNLVIKIDKILKTFENGRFLKEGINTVIVGKPNAGKVFSVEYSGRRGTGNCNGNCREQPGMSWKNRLT